MYQYKKLKLKNGKTIDEHRLIMQNHLGRKLDHDECVHHKDGNKRNNTLENLEVLRRAPHIRHHRPAMSRRLSQDNKNTIRLRFSKLTEPQVKEIRASSERNCELAKKYGVSKFVISRARLNKSWANI